MMISLKPSTFYNKGKYRGVLFNVHTSYFQVVPSSLINVIEEILNSSDSSIAKICVKTGINEDQIQYYLDFLCNEGWANRERYKWLTTCDTSYNPKILEVLYLDFDYYLDLSNEAYKKIKDIRAETCVSCAVILLDGAFSDYLIISDAIFKFKELGFHDICFVAMQKSSVFDIKFLKIIKDNGCKFFYTGENSKYYEKLDNELISGKFANTGVYDLNYFSVNLGFIKRSFNGNSTLRSLYLTSNKKIKIHPMECHPELIWSFDAGTDVLEIINSNSFKWYFSVKRKDSEVCLNCQFNTICHKPTWSRVDQLNIFSAPKDCFYVVENDSFKV